MPEKTPVGCARPTGGVVGEAPREQETQGRITETAETGGKAMITVGQKAPDFSAPAFFKNDFTSIKLSDYLGKWVALCFYPGDFTFV